MRDVFPMPHSPTAITLITVGLELLIVYSVFHQNSKEKNKWWTNRGGKDTKGKRKRKKENTENHKKSPLFRQIKENKKEETRNGGTT